MKIAVVLLNWNGRDLLEKFLPSLTRFCAGAEVVVADNGSTDDSIRFLEKNFPSVTTLVLDKNHGFAGGYNEALLKIEAEIYVLLNTDVEVTENWLEPIAEIFEDKNTAACQPKILSWHEKERFEFAGAAGGFIDYLGYPFCRGRIFNEMEADEKQYNEETEIFWASGACMFIRANLFHEAGGFDASFFAHMEEIDLCWRLKRRGYKIVYTPASVVYHVGGGTLKKNHPHKTFLNFRNNLLMLRKNLPADQRLRILFMRFLLDMTAAFRFLFTDGFSHFYAVIKAYASQAGRKMAREEFPSEKTPTCVYRNSIVKEYFVFGKRKFSELNKDCFT